MAAAAVTFVAIGCSANNDTDALVRAALALQRQGSYQASYVVVTRMEGAARPIVGEGILEFRFPDRSRLTTGGLETISIGREVWTKVDGELQRGEVAAPPLDPYLYLAASAGARRKEGGRYAFRLSVSAYRSELEGRMGILPEALAERLKAFAAEGEALIGDDGLPQEMTMRIKDTAPGSRTQIIEATFRFLEFGQEYDIEPPETESP